MKAPISHTETDIINAEIRTGLLGEWDLAKLDASPKVNTFHLYEDYNRGGRLVLELES
ncbi:uncharacterized protein PHACADRAFT_253054 [Phanerochaete carnosa HHB-10118-sp]|uniref:Uncharacterized protein n=1 Tax=Phanerochaete carnosa (strain HHB-10118-sp) TaxID=650164 RepID=K5V761_PHACS|nr:uncharacterized protein PHACADRAFT_253054 [Phanerochaete carnosa HHB-10118-sp]EKM58596.1 hypothetical protein PHACADRAFT_253054 [Phanerochaete carnosa HHB-10118-sp]